MVSLLRSLWTALFRSESFREELDDEIRFHLEARTEDLVRQGLDRRAAMRRARIEFGSVASYREEVRASHGLRLIDELRQDFRYARRVLNRSPAFALFVIGILALGVGANTAVFSVVDAVLLRPPPFESPARLVHIEGAGSRNGWISLPEYRALESRADLFESSAGYWRDMVTLTGGNEPDQVFALKASPALLRVLGVHPQLGRTIEESDAGAQAAVISHRLWQRRFDGGSDVIGRPITVAGEAFTIVG